MKITRSTLFGFGVVIVLLHLLLFPMRAPSELTVERMWAIALDSADEISREPRPAGAALVPFRLGQRFGCVSESGRLMLQEAVRYGMAYTNELYANFGAVIQNVVLQDTEGQIVTSLATAGYPLFLGDRLLTIDGVGMGLSEWSRDGVQRWHREFGSLVTSASADSGRLVVGLLSGSLSILDSRGQPVDQLRPGLSRVPAIYGVALHGSALAAISGLDPQVLALYTETENGWTEALVRPVNSRLTHPAYVAVGRDVVYYETDNGIAITRGPDFNSVEVAVEGQFVDFAQGVGPSLIAVLSQDHQYGHLVLATTSGRVISRCSFPASAVWLSQRSGALYLGIDDSFLRMGLSQS